MSKKLKVQHDEGERRWGVWIDGKWVEDKNIIPLSDMIADQEQKWGEERVANQE